MGEFLNWKKIVLVDKDGTEIVIEREANNASLMGWSYEVEIA